MGRSFAWRSLVVFLALGTLSHLLLRDVVDTHFEEALVFHAEFVVETVVAPALSRSLDPVQESSGVTDALDELVRVDEQLVGLRLTDDAGRVVVASGRDAPPTGAETANGAPRGGLAVTTVPLPAGSEATSVRVVQDALPARAAAGRLTATFDGVLVIVLLVLWVVLLPMANRLGRRLRSRADELEAQGGELQRLLDREHQSVARLEELSELKDSFLSAVSHELRTPLTVVVGSLMTLRRRHVELTTEQRCDLLSRAERSAVKLDVLLTGLLDLNPRSRGRSATPHEHVDLRELVSEATAHLPPRPLDIDLEVERLTGDPLKLERVLANLIGNAIRHAPDAGPITVRSRSVDDEVELVVADRGPGVPDELKQAIFDPFRQGAITDAHSPGTGIGLSLVARFVAEHSGRTWVEDRPGGGACFHVRLPRGPREVSLAVAADGAQREWTDARVGSH